MPNGLQIITPQHDFKFAKADTLKVKIKDNYLAEAFIAEGNQTWANPGSIIQGKWSTIYD
jgi:hypothetical protein